MFNKFTCMLVSFKSTIWFLSMHDWSLISFAVCTYLVCVEIEPTIRTTQATTPMIASYSCIYILGFFLLAQLQ